jgi:excisionase family DNA binding protein
VIETCTTDEMATLIGVSERTVRELAAKGRLIRAGRGRLDVPASVATYCGHLRDAASGKSAGPNLTDERTRLAKEQADRMAIENEKNRGNLIDAKEAESRWAGEMVSLRARFLAIKTSAAMKLPHLTPHELAVIDQIVRDAMAKAAGGGDE